MSFKIDMLLEMCMAHAHIHLQIKTTKIQLANPLWTFLVKKASKNGLLCSVMLFINL